MAERKILNKGWEHKIYQSRQNEEIILKVPHKITMFSLNTFFEGYKTIKKEINDSQLFINNSAIKIPPTRIFKINKGYIIAQKYIHDDQSVNIHETLISNPKLLSHYESNASNFSSQEGTIYWLDPTKGPIGRLVEKLGIIEHEEYKKITLGIKKIIRKINKKQSD